MERKLAPADGIQIVNGKRFLAVKGEPLMPDAEFQEVAADEAPKPKAAKTAPAETTKGSGPSETAD